MKDEDIERTKGSTYLDLDGLEGYEAKQSGLKKTRHIQNMFT